MSTPKIAPYGSWKSPLHAKEIAEGTLTLHEVLLDGDRVYWIEHRPTEGGRYAVVRREPDGTMCEMIPEGFSARTRVHEYGGGSYLPIGDELLFVNFADQRLYRTCAGADPKPLTPEGDVRYADFVFDADRRRLITIREDHTGEDEAVNTVAAVDLETGESTTLVEGNDFYMSPRISPDGSQLAYLTWNHPSMPWDAAELWVASIREDGSLGEARHIAGGPAEAIVQPEWSPDGTLWFISDRTDWWNLYRVVDDEVEAMTDLDAEFGYPAWGFRMSRYAFDGPDRVVCAFTQNGLWQLATLAVATRELTPIDTPYNAVASVRAANGKVVFIAGPATKPVAVVTLDLATREVCELKRASEKEIGPGYVSVGEPFDFPTEGGLTAHAIFYPPKNDDFTAPKDELPPLVVMIHGGPTSATSAALKSKVQYYTSRGVAVCDVNYGGSTGYGRQYRERLQGSWGIVDVDDACNAAKFLAAEGRVDPERLAITGGSAGGYTTLSCLAFRDTFAAGSSHYGVSDCEALAVETHKFESRYLDGLIAPYPEGRAVYHERSAIYHLEGFNCPVAFFQGLEDEIVPPDQARMLADALRKKGIPFAHLEFAGEQHGFRKSENIVRALEGELYFFSRVFGFDLADEVEPIEIENLQERG